MQHVSYLGAIITMGIFLIVLTRSILAYQRERLRFQKIFIIALSLLYYYFLPNMIFSYFRIVDEPTYRSALGKTLRIIDNLQKPVLLALVAFLFIRLFLLLQREGWRRSWLIAFWGALGLSAAFRMATILSLFALPPSRQHLLYEWALLLNMFLFYGSVTAVALRTQFKRFDRLNPAQSRALIWFGRTMAAILIFSFAVDLANIFGLTAGETASRLSVLAVFLFIAAALVLLPPLIVVMYPHLDAGGLSEAKLQSLIDEYGISTREKEVILLICRGKTNKEIEAALCISMPTVKDHISNIFRKTGVANRVQLAALFHFMSDR